MTSALISPHSVITDNQASTSLVAHAETANAAAADPAYDIGLPWINEFAKLSAPFTTELAPEPLPAPYWVGQSRQVAEWIGLDAIHLQSPQLLNALSGNAQLAGSRPLASVYSGHQFGQWAGQLGDGRAILLGEVAHADAAMSPAGLEIQLKGAGRTPYSRMGDGRAVLRSSIREFLCSEAMHALGIATSRALCITGSDARVLREELETAAVVTRIAPSFIRFGHFEHFSHSDQHDQLKVLADYVIERYYPDCLTTDKFNANPYAALLEKVSERTARTLAQWQSVGFCHGVMNTDNMSILGLTIDYGPFQFLDAYVPNHICNHSDAGGRYAFNKQPNIAYWNLYALGQALLPLIGEQELAIAALESYKTVFPQTFEAQMRAKLGLSDVQPGDRELIESSLKLLAKDAVDYTIFWRRLSRYVAQSAMKEAIADHDTDGTQAAVDRSGTKEPTDPVHPVRDLFMNRAGFDVWLQDYAARISSLNRADVGALMLKSNPKFVLRNHLGEQAIRAAKTKDFSNLATLQKLLESPFDEHLGFEAFADFPPDWASGIEISCSS